MIKMVMMILLVTLAVFRMLTVVVIWDDLVIVGVMMSWIGVVILIYVVTGAKLVTFTIVLVS